MMWWRIGVMAVYRGGVSNIGDRSYNIVDIGGNIGVAVISGVVALLSGGDD